MKQIPLRILATFAVTSLGIIGSGAIVGIDVYQSALMAGISGVAQAVDGLARAYLQDGKLSDKEINEVFQAVETKTRKSN